jgi:hypothetical protein
LRAKQLYVNLLLVPDFLVSPRKERPMKVKSNIKAGPTATAVIRNLA